MYLRCSGNNWAVTILRSFTDAIADYGIPGKVQTDLGGENVEVWRYMIHEHNLDRSVGSSTHNERFECLWRDVFLCVGSFLFHIQATRRETRSIK